MVGGGTVLGRARKIVGDMLFAGLCLCLVLWTLAPAAAHLDAISAAVEAEIDDHGHSHDAAGDIYLAAHGHDHDSTDHDHAKALVAPAVKNASAASTREPRRLAPDTGGHLRPTRIERPPRA